MDDGTSPQIQRPLQMPTMLLALDTAGQQCDGVGLASPSVARCNSCQARCFGDEICWTRLCRSRICEHWRTQLQRKQFAGVLRAISCATCLLCHGTAAITLSSNVWTPHLNKTQSISSRHSADLWLRGPRVRRPVDRARQRGWIRHDAAPCRASHIALRCMLCACNCTSPDMC